MYDKDENIYYPAFVIISLLLSDTDETAKVFILLYMYSQS